MTDAATIRAALDHLLDHRGPGKSICPSEVARALRPDGDWRALMPTVRDVAATEAANGRLLVTQGTATVDANRARGPIRLKRP